MKWVEVISLRHAGTKRARLNQVMAGLSGSQEVPTGIKVYEHAFVDTDVSIHLHWEGIGPGREASNLALRILDALMDFGLVNHSVWIERTNLLL